MDDSISLTDLRSDLAEADAELGRIEETARPVRERRERLTNLIRGLEEYQQEKERERQAAPKLRVVASIPVTKSAVVEHREPTVAERVIGILESARHFMTTRELVNELTKIGYRPNSKKTMRDAVYGTLHGALKVKGTRLVKNAEAKWGLREWLAA